jgi:hypothetical protein
MGYKSPAGCAAAITAVGPTALRIAYIEAGDNDCSSIAAKELIEFEPISECLAEELLKARLDPIVKDFDTIDEALLKCSLPERYGTLYSQGEDAGDFCPARHVYPQYAQARKQIEDLTMEVESGAPLFKRVPLAGTNEVWRRRPARFL